MNKEKTELIERNKHIPTAEIKQDIVDTLAEISQMEKEAKHLKATPLSMREARWDHMRAEGRLSGIKDRKEFIKKLENLLKLRGELEEVK